MDYSAPVREVKSRSGSSNDVHRLGEWDIAAPGETLAECLALDVRHHVVDDTAVLPRIMKWDDVRVAQSCGGCDF